MNRLYVGQSTIPGAGRGVFAGMDIAKGELIEQCPIIEIDPDHAERINETMLVHYIYYLGKKKEKASIVLGLGSIYNHSYEANAQYVDRCSELLVDFEATADIKKGEEILVNYNPEGQQDSGKLWFEIE